MGETASGMPAGTQAWRYDGRWQRIPFPYEWNDDEDQEVALRRAGFGASRAWGPNLLNVVQIAEADDEYWMVSICVDGNHVHTIEVTGLPNLLALIPQLAAFANAELFATTEERLDNVIRRAVGEPVRRERP